MFDAVYIINLDRTPSRWAHVRTVMERAGLAPVTRVPAIDGQALDAAAVRDLQQQGRLASELSGFSAPSQAGEIGCGLSHLRVLDEIITRGWRAALVLEDDIELAGDPGDWRTRCEQAFADLPDTWQLWYLYRCFDVKHRTTRRTPRTVVPYSPQGGAAYAVSAQSAELLRTALLPLARPVDAVYADLVRTGRIEAYAASPLLVDPGRMPSEINRDNPDRAWVQDGVNRPPEYWPEEYLAHLGEAPGGAVASWWQRGVGSLRQWLGGGGSRS